MFDRISSTLHTCNEARKRWRELGKKLLRNPFLPILFIGETVKIFTLSAIGGTLFPPTVIALIVLSIITTIIWVFAEHILDEAEETIDQIDEEVDVIK